MRYRQFCALARAAELLGERWTLLIVRELLLGPRRFKDLRAGLAGVSTSVLAARLAAMERSGLVGSTELPPPAAMPVYALTPPGEALRPAVHELIRWGGRFLFPPRSGDDFDPGWALLALQACARRGRSPRLAFTVRLRNGDREAVVGVRGGRSGTRVTRGPLPKEDAVVSGRFEMLLAVLGGAISPERAIQDRMVEVIGDREAFGQLPEMFDVARDAPPGVVRAAREGAREG